jgi:hypothetical protein
MSEAIHATERPAIGALHEVLGTVNDLEAMQAAVTRLETSGFDRADLNLPEVAAPVQTDVHLPTTDGRELLLTRYTQPEPELRLLMHQLKLELPPQPPPSITTGTVPKHLL